MSLSTKLLILVAIFVVGGLSGWKTHDAFCDAAAAKLEVSNLRKQIEARDAAAAQDQKRAADDAEKLAQLEGTVRDLQDHISAGDCFSADDTDGLRKLWK